MIFDREWAKGLLRFYSDKYFYIVWLLPVIEITLAILNTILIQSKKNLKKVLRIKNYAYVCGVVFVAREVEW